ncbi:MAG: hypothetical protein IKV86_03595 [Clostridia bacterium]|nr:hypothetical protein [Clostridia bacterium]
MQKTIPTYDEYKAEIEKRFPGIDEKYIQERYKGYYSESNVKSPDIDSEATDIRVEVTGKVPAELEKTVKAVKVRSGIDIVFGNRYVDGKLDTKFRGLFDGKKIIVSENASKADIFNAVVLHELTHGIEGTKKYKGIYDYVLKEMYGNDTARLDEDVEAKIAEYKKNGIELTPEKAKGEIVAENVGKYIFADDVGSIVTKNYTLGQKILDVINELIYNIKKKFGNTFELDELASAQRKYRMALDEVKRNGVKNTSGIQYDIYDMGTHNRVVIANDITKELNIDTPSKLKDHIRNNYSEIKVSLPDGTKGVTYVTERGAGEYAYSEYSMRLKGKEKYDKYRMADNIDEIIKAQIKSTYEDPKHLRNDDIVGFYRSPIEVQVGSRLYDCELVTGITRSGTEEFYDVVNMNLKNENEPYPTLAKRISVKGRRDSDSSIDMLSQKNTDVNSNYMQNTENNSASAEKTEMQLAYEKALAKSGNNEQYSFASQNDIDSAVADFEAHYGEMYRNMIDKYGAIKPGEIPQVEDVKVPKKSGKGQYVSNYARTMAETKAFSDAMQGEFEKMVVDGTLSHERISNKSAESDAGSRIVRLGFEGAVNEFETLVNAGRVNKNDIALGQMLLNVACQNKDVELAKKPLLNPLLIFCRKD